MRQVSLMMVLVAVMWLIHPTRSFAKPVASVAKAATANGHTGKTAEKTDANLMDLNMASRDQLMQLPGIGEDEAKKIIAGRPYQAKTDLLKKGVLSVDTFYGLVDRVTISWDALAKEKKAEEEKPFKAAVTSKAKRIKTRSGLVYQDLVIGSGKPALKGSTVQVQYTGWLKNGTKFDSSRDRSEAYSFALGTGAVIRGWDEGVQSMRVGGKRILTIPAKLGYGAEGSGDKIPPKATLIFEIELVDVE